jgi:hypothetical protein
MAATLDSARYLSESSCSSAAGSIEMFLIVKAPNA